VRPHPYYKSKRWAVLRADQLRREPLCRMCLSVGRVTAANTVDHVTPWHNWDSFCLNALQSLCPSCHDRKRAARDYQPDIGPDGFPLDPRHPCYQQRPGG
jgi:5-methylcytosine-specific restriction protein A